MPARIPNRRRVPLSGGAAARSRRDCVEFGGAADPPSEDGDAASDDGPAEGVEPAEEVEEPPPRGAAALFDDWGL